MPPPTPRMSYNSLNAFSSSSALAVELEDRGVAVAAGVAGAVLLAELEPRRRLAALAA